MLEGGTVESVGFVRFKYWHNNKADTESFFGVCFVLGCHAIPSTHGCPLNSVVPSETVLANTESTNVL